jgi:hypothetical protein
MKRLITVTAAVLTLGLAAIPAASAAVASGKSGTEVIQGSTTKLSVIQANAPVVPLKAYGVVDAYGTINLGGPTNGRSTLYFHAGNLRVKHTQTRSTKPSFNLKSCVFSQVESGVYTVVGGTGKFYGAKGNGKYVVDFTVKFARLKNGKCNTSQSAVPIGGKISFLAYGPLSVR